MRGARSRPRLLKEVEISLESIILLIELPGLSDAIGTCAGHFFSNRSALPIRRKHGRCVPIQALATALLNLPTPGEPSLDKERFGVVQPRQVLGRLSFREHSGNSGH